MASEHAVSPSWASEAPNPRRRGRTACTRCKSRKQKCDDQLPICSNCQRAGATCDKADVTDEATPVAYVRALEDRVAFLETKLEHLHNVHPPASVQPQAQAQAQTQLPAQGSCSSPGGPGPVCSPANTTSGKESAALNDIVALMALGEAEGAAAMDSSAGPSLSMILHEMVQATVWNKSLPEASSPRDAMATAGNRSNEWARRISVEELIAKSAKEPPSDALGSKIIRAYFQQLHPRYPFLDADEIWGLHEKRHALTQGVTKTSPREQRLGIFKLYLVYATGATLLQLTEKLTFSPEGFYMMALQHTSAAREARTIHNIEAMTLLVVYHLRSASSHGIWYMIGLAMRTCIDLGMHRKSHEQNLSAEDVDWRRRLFWTVYSLERTIAISLGRPLSIPDRQIDVPLPEPGRPTTASTSTSPQDPSPSPSSSSSLTMALHLFRLRRIESRIYHSIYRSDKPLATLRPKIDPLYASLSAWRVALLTSLPPSSPELNYPLLHYNRTLRLLIQPFLPILPLTDAFHGFCLRAAGDICQAHKRLHQTLDYGHSFIAVQTVFVAGLTLLHGLWRWTDEVWSVALADDLRACSLVLFVMGERAPWVRRYRDAFEMLIDAAMEKLRKKSGPHSPRQTFAGGGSSREAGPSRKRQRTEYAEQESVGNRASPQRDYEPLAEPPSPELYASGGIAAGEGGDAWPIVMELTNWIEQDGGSPIWMPDFEVLQNLSGPRYF